MRTVKSLLCIIAIIATMSATAQNKPAQTYKVVNGTIVLNKTKADTTKAQEKVYARIDGITYYIGAKGGVYYYRVSKKTGEKYKCYLKQENKQQ